MKAYFGDVVFTPTLNQITTISDGYIVVDENGIVDGCYQQLPQDFSGAIVDYSGKLIIPAFSDLHLHASQLPSSGLGYDGNGEDWFTKYTYPVEKKYSNPEYAHEVNKDLIYNLWKNGIMRSVIMCTTDPNSTKDLFNQFMKSGLSAYIGKMNSDYPAFGEANETTEDSISQTIELIKWSDGKSSLVKYIISPEFVPACSEELMGYLGNFARDNNLPVQSHMCEGEFDLEMVAQRFPKDKVYGEVWNKYGLFGQTPTVMAHCMFASDSELELMGLNKVFIAHCPHASVHIPSGKLLSVRKCLDKNIPVGIGSDIGGGHTLSMQQNIIMAIQISKLLPQASPLNLKEAFYLATKSGGSFFGKVGSFELGYEFDALVIDDRKLNRHLNYTLEERLHRFIYCGSWENISNRFCSGKEIIL